ncbi:STAS domain-containing protein [Kribbella sp. CA-247076]|uniref:STAS domain-containing protein n=1 Tax=Kribbella sp. CA-247076 TaxID=3239941 RepID=UPI003D903303
MSDDELSVHTTDAGDHVVVRVDGDLDLESAPVLTAELKRLVGPRPLLLDLGGVDFMDSSGLGVLVGAHKESAAQGGALVIAAPGARVRKIFRITKLHKVFTVHETLDEAVAGLAAPLEVDAAPVETVVPGFGTEPHDRP